MIESLSRGLKKIETHISWVLLDEKYAYKIKKPVKFWFLDYSTLERRKFFCEEEMRLNSRLSPEIYLGVVPITKDGQGNFAIEDKILPLPSGERVGVRGNHIVDYAVKMVRLPEEANAQRLLSAGRLESKRINELIDKVVGFHESARVILESDHDYTKKITYLHEQDIGMATGLAKDLKGDLATVEGVLKSLGCFIDKNYELFRKRQLGGKVRECHGDLHSRNIYLTDKPVFIDCIEFNEVFRYKDILCEVAFMAMDFERWGDSETASLIWDEYFKVTGEERVDTLINFHTCRLALIRGMIAALRGEEAAPYFDLAERYSLRFSMNC